MDDIKDKWTGRTIVPLKELSEAMRDIESSGDEVITQSSETSGNELCPEQLEAAEKGARSEFISNLSRGPEPLG